jgi:glycosyltransferase involved in cell wall biosynthesis
VHDEIMHGYFFWFRSKILIPLLYRRANLIVTVNNGIARELIENYTLSPDRITTIGNYYNFDEIKKMSQESKGMYWDQLYRDPVLVTTGRLAPEKGLHAVLKIFIALKKLRPNLRFVIVGQGPEYNVLAKLCEEASLRVAHSIALSEIVDVVFTGNQENVYKYLNGAKLYLMNSSSEGFPNGLVEAMICGLPVISSDCPYGPREIIAPNLNQEDFIRTAFLSRYGILMPVAKNQETISLWVETIDSLLGDDDKLIELVRNGNERIKAFEDKQILNQWLKILD